MLTNRQVAEKFASQLLPSGNAGHLFFEGQKIYSYGYHFPIARILPEENVALFTSKGYSNTTSKHKSLTHGALYRGGFRILELPEVETLSDSRNKKYFPEEIKNAEDKAKRARLQSSRDGWQRQAEALKEDYQFFQNLLNRA